MSLTGLMTAPPHRLSPDASVHDAAELMGEHVLGAVAVERAGRLCGIFTYRDLINRVVRPGRSPDATRLEEVMTRTVERLSKEASCSEALRLMVGSDYTYVPIVDADDHVIGLVSLRELLQHRIDDLADELDSLSKYHAVDGPGG